MRNSVQNCKEEYCCVSDPLLFSRTNSFNFDDFKELLGKVFEFPVSKDNILKTVSFIYFPGCFTTNKYRTFCQKRLRVENKLRLVPVSEGGWGPTKEDRISLGKQKILFPGCKYRTGVTDEGK